MLAIVAKSDTEWGFSRRELAYDVVALVSTALGTMLAAVAIYGPWGWRRSVPLSEGFDFRLHALFAQLAMHGDVTGTDRLGAPFGLHMADFAIGNDRLSLWAFRALGTFISDPITVVNVYFLASFAFVASAGYLVARALGVQRVLSIAVGILYAFVPYHFSHDAMHAFLSNYSGIALVVLVAIWAAQREIPVPWITVPRASWRHRDSAKLGAIGLIVVYGGSLGGYYAAFGVLVLIGGGVIGAMRQPPGTQNPLGRGRIFAAALIVAGALGAVTLANNVGSLSTRAADGTNHEVAFRTVGENERYALHITQAIVPGPEHRVGFLADAGTRAREGDQPGEPGTYLGIVALLGVAAAIVNLLLWGLRPRDRSIDDVRDDDDPVTNSAETMTILGGLSVWILAFATVGGLGMVIAVAGVSQFRAWGRLSIVLSLLGFLAAALYAQRWWQQANRRPSWMRYSVLGIVMAVALLDQIPASVRPNYASERISYDATRAFVAEMESALPRDAMVFQLPVARFPEAGPTGAMEDYSLLVPYLVGSNSLRWSYGGMKGRAQDWQLTVANQSFTTMITSVAAAGFDALYLDRRAYADRGAAIERQLAPLTGPPVATSADGRLSWFDLRPRHHALVQLHGKAHIAAVGKHVVHSVVPRISGKVSGTPGAWTGEQRWIGATSSLRMDNTLNVDRAITVQLHLQSPTATRVTLRGFGPSKTITLQPEVATKVVVAGTLRANQSADLTMQIQGRTIPNIDNALQPKAKLLQVQIDERFVSQSLG